ncbi:helix-turn-helix transcriptional regulator [Pseudomonas brassicacearum]|jgi:Predicted transcriptional regulators|uniref:Putative transcription factor, PadR family n=1 Tax=Pseudomonas brassicacearum (strain NFM421) TaxID=994484 RepID=F2KKX8_PSEBN|nr:MULTISPECIES: PadR family transcriptional regulator [Pseudomonas]EIK57998.1 transcriptional regulator, PadR family [Pseudomonas fluorescens Q8r1-96]KIR16766.1 Transcriptional regulator YqjI [Pseudomonas fluorescens]AEA70940.1 Putative transcription factor, PadR family [Pseudomonas brassicacearum subsp. brassicacearum NFM421]AOS41434.1 PadR family transcriptional regulator [Pseudomonas brassicacearum]KAB0526627.1 PadR family transcriptional regulator [Pseudomonas brassicacearum subsp. brassi
MTDPYSHFKREYEHDGFERHSARRERNSRAPRVFAAGDLKLLSLALIAEQPCHGYDLIRRIENMFDGAYSPSPGVIYPTLSFLEMSAMVTCGVDDGKKCYSVTDAGRLLLEDQAQALDEVRTRIEISKRTLRGHDRPPEIQEAVYNLRHALQKHPGHWSPEEIRRVRDLLNDTAKAIIDGPDRPPVSESSQ